MKISSSQLRQELTRAIMRGMDLARFKAVGMDKADSLAGAVLEQCGFGEVPRLANPPELEDLPSVAGDQLGGSLANFTLRCLVLLNEELNAIAPDNARVALLCDAVRLARDYEKVALKAEDAGVVDRLERISFDPPRAAVNKLRDRGQDWGKPIRYLSDDRDEPRPNELQIMRGGNGDFYVSVCPRGERTMQGVRLATSGGASFEVPALVSAMCDAYDALYFAERDARHRGGVSDPNNREGITRLDVRDP